MTKIERCIAAVSFQTPDRTPVIAQVFGHAARLARVPLGDYLQQGEVLAKAQINALNVYDYDAVFALMDVNVETEAVGSTLNYKSDDYATITRFALERMDAFDPENIPNPLRAGRMPELLKAAKLLRDEVGDDVLVVGCVMGPLTLTTQLLGMEKALYLAVDEPDRFEAVLDYALEIVKIFGAAQLDAGVHLPIVFDPSASPAAVPSAFFREFELPRLKCLFSHLKDNGSKGGWLHIAGPVEPIMPYYPEAGVDIANFDYCVSYKDAREALPNTCLDGNITPFDFVSETPDVIAEQAKSLLIKGKGDNGFILSSGCEIPPEANVENIKAMVQAVR